MRFMTAGAAAACLIALAGARVHAQDTPQEIAKAELPRSAVCTVCEANGGAHGAEKPAAGVRYKGRSFYFCAAKELAVFKKDPDSYLPPVLPRPAPKFTARTVDDAAFEASSFRDKVVLVDFWATWCAPCVASMPEMQRLHDRYASKGFTVAGVSIDEEGAKKVKPFLAKRKLTYPIFLDTDRDAPTWKAFGVHAVPAVFLIDRSGQIVRQWTGKVNPKEAERAVTELLGSDAAPKAP